MHAIGDKAFVQAVRAIKAALDDLPREDHRHTIIHACLPTAEEIAVCERYHINLAVQTAFIDWPQEPGQLSGADPRRACGQAESDPHILRTRTDFKCGIGRTLHRSGPAFMDV